MEGTTYSFYAYGTTGADYGSTSLTFATSSAMPSGTTYNWKFKRPTDTDWGSFTGSGYTSSSYTYGSIGGFWTSGFPANFQVKCEVSCDGYESVESDPITVKVLPKSIPNFYVEIYNFPGEQNPTTPTVCYKVADSHSVGVKLWRAGGETAEIPPNGSGATFTWKTEAGDTIWTGTTQEEMLNVSSILTAMGWAYADLTPWDGTGAQPAGGRQVRITCTINLDGQTRNSDSSSTYETYNVLTLYRQP